MPRRTLAKASVISWSTLLVASLLLLLVVKTTPWRVTLITRRVSQSRLPLRRFGVYGEASNSISPKSEDVATIVGIRPPMEAPKRVWKFAWSSQRRVQPLFHWRDVTHPPDSSLSLAVLWWKAISACDKRSTVFEQDGWTYDMLPSGSRLLLKLPGAVRLLPRLHHANVEMRTAYLDRTIRMEIDRVPVGTKIRLISLGAGYDTRCAKLLSGAASTNGISDSQRRIDEAWEFDLPPVQESKKLMFSRLQKRRKRRFGSDCETALPSMLSVNLNDVDGEFWHRLQQAIETSATGTSPWHTIFVSEGVMIYLDKGVPRRLLEVLGEAIAAFSPGSSASFCFADRLEDIPGQEIEAAVSSLDRAGWELIN